MTNGIMSHRRVPSSLTLLLIQAGGGALALLPIASLRQFANLNANLYWVLVCGAAVNVVVSLVLLVGHAFTLAFFSRTVGRFGELGLCRAIILYDTLMLGTLVFSTGGAEKSVFAPQFAAILPMAMLIPDTQRAKWAYVGMFLIMFLVGFLLPSNAFSGYLPDRPEKQMWFLVFFMIFTLFPATYSIQAERAAAAL